MPIYEYVCPACGERTEKMQRITERENGPGCGVCGEGMVLALSMPGRVSGGTGSGTVPQASCGGSGFT